MEDKGMKGMKGKGMKEADGPRSINGQGPSRSSLRVSEWRAV